MPNEWVPSCEKVLARQAEAFVAAWGVDVDALERDWKAWVLRKYRDKKF